MKTTSNFIEEILRTKLKPEPGYGGNVLPAIKIYAELDNFEERKAFQDALETMLKSSDEDICGFAVNVCLGFFVFRDVIKR